MAKQQLFQGIHGIGVTALILVFALGCLYVQAGESKTSMRMVKITVTLDGELILDGSTGDNGYPDADQVWSYLKTQGLKPTDNFPAGVELDEEKNVAEINGDVLINIRYGGQLELKRIQLKYNANGRNGRVWTVAPEVVEDGFSRRLISRRLASLLNEQEMPEE